MTTYYNPCSEKLVMECDFCARLEDNIDRIPLGWTRYTTRRSILDACPSCQKRMTNITENFADPYSDPILKTTCVEH